MVDLIPLVLVLLAIAFALGALIPLAIRAGAVVVPGTRSVAGPFAAEHGLSMSVALLVKDRDAGTDARIALEDVLR